MTTQVILNNLYTRTHKSLDGNVKARVLDFITKLQHDPTAPGLDVKRPKGAVDPHVRTARVNDFWRAVLFELPDSVGYVLAAVKPHDDAYVYAAQLRMEVNAATGALEVIDQLAIDQAVATATQVADEPTMAAIPLLTGISLAKLRAFGLASDVAERALGIVDDESFEALCDALPVIQGCALLDLRAGKDPDDVYRDLIGQEEPEAIDPEDILTALSRPSSRLQFASGDNEELLAAIEGDLQAWRIWLHPLQRSLAYHDGWNGPFRVTGGAGTGKTVTALHRARHLAERDGREALASSTVLVATYTRNLADALRHQFVELAGSETAARVDIINLDALAHRIIDSVAGPKPRLVADSDTTVDQAWSIAAAGTDWDARFLADEWLHVVLAQGITSQTDYLKAARPGRGVPLNRAKRVTVWGLIEKAVQHLGVSGVMTFTQAAAKAADIAAGAPELGFRHAVIDEAQDLHPAHWRLVRALVPDGPDDLFIVGDAHQRIYGRPLVLSRYGIRTQGRSRRLTINYRTSEQILRWCLAVMSGAPVDDLEGADDTLAGARSEFKGPDPVLSTSAGTAQEDQALVQQVQSWMAEGYPPDAVAVLSRTRTGVDAALKALKDAGLPARVLDRSDSDPVPGVVAVMTMHRAKGLEFPVVAISRLGAQHFPPSGAGVGNQLDRETRSAQERALLYVAGSRARERLSLFATGTPSPFLGPSND